MGQSINGDAGWSINDRYYSDGSSTWQSGYSSDYYLGWPG